jgi:peptidoglycan/xylan/chitin deacetylase (PgdA/CDA1 family)
LPLAASIAIASVIAATAATTYAALSAQSQLFGPTLIAGNDPNEVALTYDDGPSDTATLALLDILARYNARATFFVIGRFVRQSPGIVRAVQAAGHLIGNHTETHPWLTLLPAKSIHQEFADCNAALEDTLGASVRYVRFPHGARRPAVLRIARDLGLTPVQWNVMAHDWKPIGVAGILSRVDAGLARAARRHTGANICMHDGHQAHSATPRPDTLTATDRLLTRFAEEKKRLVTVDAWDK